MKEPDRKIQARSGRHPVSRIPRYRWPTMSRN